MKNKIKILVVSFLALALIGIFSISCKKKNYTFQDEMDKLNVYISEKYLDTIQPTSTGLYYIEIQKGTGFSAIAGKYVSVWYKGYFLDGTVFDQNLDADKPYRFLLGAGAVIAGWDEGISHMKDGGKAILIVPSSLAYWSAQTGSIPPYTTLIFEVELDNVE